LALEAAVIICKDIALLSQLLDEFQVVIEFGLQIPGFVLCSGIGYSTDQPSSRC
jgi:hypothetical protein